MRAIAIATVLLMIAGIPAHATVETPFSLSDHQLLVVNGHSLRSGVVSVNCDLLQVDWAGEICDFSSQRVGERYIPHKPEAYSNSPYVRYLRTQKNYDLKAAIDQCGEMEKTMLGRLITICQETEDMGRISFLVDGMKKEPETSQIFKVLKVESTFVAYQFFSGSTAVTIDPGYERQRPSNNDVVISDNQLCDKWVVIVEQVLGFLLESMENDSGSYYAVVFDGASYKYGYFLNKEDLRVWLSLSMSTRNSTEQFLGVLK